MNTSALHTFWTCHRTTILRLIVALMAVLALLKLGNGFQRLIWELHWTGAVDLKRIYICVHHWFSGSPVYGVLNSDEYPPASYAVLWPLLGWLDITPARWFWAATSVAALWWLICLVVRESGADKPLECVFVALLPLSMNATGWTIGHGQLIVHILPIMIAGFILLHQGRHSWRNDVIAGVLIIVALAKPAASIPFFWIALFVPCRLRPALIITLGYVVLTIFAASFQEPGLISLYFDWMSQSLTGAAYGSIHGGYGNLHTWLTTLGLKEWNLPASLLVLIATGYWTYRHRHVDLWIQMGVIAIVARFWVYHRLYDDILFLLPIVALFRITKGVHSAAAGNMMAGTLLAVSVLVTHAPARKLLDSPWALYFKGGHVVVWTIVLIFLLVQAQYEKDKKII